MNETIRCLDVNVPPNDPEFARLSREILKCCVRNTERAAGEVGRFEHGGSSLGSGDALGLGLGFGPSGARGGVWGLIEKSELAKVVKEEAEKERLNREQRQLDTVSGKEKYDVWKYVTSNLRLWRLAFLTIVAQLGKHRQKSFVPRRNVAKT